MALSIDTAIGSVRLVVPGGLMEVSPALVSGSVEWSTGGLSELRLELADPELRILREAQLEVGDAAGTKAGTLVTLSGQVFEIRSIEHSQDGNLILEARGAKACAMKRSERGKGAETTPNTSPTSWVQRVGNWYGLRVHAQETPVRDQITRQAADGAAKAESDWDVVQRLASEEGMLAFECDGVLSFGKPSWLVQRPGYPPLRVEMEHIPGFGPRPLDPRILTRPSPRRSGDNEVAVAQWSVQAEAKWAAGLGSIGFGGHLVNYSNQFDGVYLVDRITVPLDSAGDATISFSTPVDPTPVSRNDLPQGSSSSGASSGSLSSPGAGSYGGVNLSSEQVRNALTIIQVGAQLGIPTKGLVVALATAMQESSLKNLNYGDRDSLGLFQQRPSQGWGSASQVTDPVYAAKKFFETLLKVPGWQGMAVTAAAQAVQRSGFPGAYAKWESMASSLTQAILATAKTSSQASSAPGPITKVLAFARAQIGKPYQWGGTGNPSYDCSGLVQAAYRQVGIDITRTTYTQLANPRLAKVSLANLRAGDIWFPNSGHVQLVSVGNGGKSRVIEAQTEGVPILEGPMWSTAGEGRRVIQ